MDERTKEALQKQLQLLLERSKDSACTSKDLADLSHAMMEIAVVFVSNNV